MPGVMVKKDEIWVNALKGHRKPVQRSGVLSEAK